MEKTCRTGSMARCFAVLLTLTAILHFTNSATPPQPFGSAQQTNPNHQTQPIHLQRPKFSSKIPSQIPRRKQQLAQSTQVQTDYSGGFPSGFTQGLPTFDFSAPMAAAATTNEKGEPESADTENVGFVHGPPDGFPTLEQLGGNFGFSNMRDNPGGGGQSYSEPPPAPQQYRPQFHQQSGSTSHHTRQNHPNEPEEDYLSGPGPSSLHSNIELRKPGVPVKRPPRPQHKPQPHSRPEAGSGSSRDPQYLPAREYSSPYLAKRPVVIKVSGKKVLPTKLPPGPPVFYAPSPDVQPSSQQEPSQRPQPSNHHPQRFRYRRAILTSSPKDPKADQVADGSETFWEVSSPFILFDTYKTQENHNPSHQTSSSPTNLSVSDHESGEQRFFPSFPAPNPYLPFGVPPSRPALFPGPVANRAPSRYHPQFGPTKYNAQSIPPNRGPSGVYSAESHDHDRYQDNNLLGSGNFEVIRGGTYYEDDDAYNSGFHGGGNDHHGVGHQEDADYYHHNGHSSPSSYRQPGTDFFANFRDFADINPPSRSYSHRHETLAMHPAASNRQPKNILEKLESSADSNRIPVHRALSRESDPMMATF